MPFIRIAILSPLFTAISDTSDKFYSDTAISDQIWLIAIDRLSEKMAIYKPEICLVFTVRRGIVHRDKTSFSPFNSKKSC